MKIYLSTKTVKEITGRMITQQEIFNKVGAILAELNQQHKFLAKDSDQLNDLEIELFLANADFLADHVRVIQKLNSGKSNHPDHVERDSIYEISKNDLGALSPESDNAAEGHALEEIVAAEIDEERVDIAPEVEITEQEEVKEYLATSKSEDFFKPDLDNHSFEFELESVSEARGDLKGEELAVDKEEEVPAIYDSEGFDKVDLPVTDEDEIGPEPFLIHEETENIAFEEEKADAVEIPHTSAYVAPTTEERNERNGIDLRSGLSSSSGVGTISSFSPEVVNTNPLPNIFEKKERGTLNDLLANKTNKPEPTKRAPISDLKHAINLNEKMLFIKELFGGYNMAYSEALDLVNKMTTFENAENFLRNNYAAKNNWAGKQNTVDQFYELLHRRFDK